MSDSRRRTVYVAGPSPKPLMDAIAPTTTLILLILSFVGGLFLKGVSLGGTYATQADLAKALTELRAYIDTANAQTLAKAVDHSDSNRLQTLNDMKTQSAATQESLSKTQSKVDSIAVKQDLMFDTMRQMQQTQQAQAPTLERRGRT